MTRKIYHKDRVMMRSVSMLSLLLFMMISTLLFFTPAVKAFIGNNPSLGDDAQFTGDFDWNSDFDPNRPTSNTDYVTYTQYRTTTCTFASTASACDLTDDGKIIRFDTAEELYRWSIDVSFELMYSTETEKFTEAQVAVILDQNYALGNNIDYSTMNAKTFSPIGYWFNDVESVLHSNIFTGTFDGQGFTISNLYVGGYEYMIFTDIDSGNEIDIAMSKYYSVFTYNAGTITDLRLVNPTLEMLNLHIDVSKVSNLVGLNTSTGHVDHVAVIDTRTSVTDAGIRYNVGTSSGSFSAAGIVHTNIGVFTNSYFSSILVVNGSYFNKFSAQPALYQATGYDPSDAMQQTLLTGSSGHLVYDSTVYLYPTVTVGSSTFTVTPPNAFATGEATTTLKSTSSSLNFETDHWYFYPSDSYPLTQGLDYVGGVYQINNAVDMAFFSRALSFVSQNNGVSFAAASYHLTADIDMATIAPGAYVTPSVNFTGTFSGQSGSTLANNFILFNLSFTTGIIRSTSYYAGLFSVISGAGNVHDLTIDDSSVALTDTESYYSNTFFIGTVCGKLSGGTIEDVMVNVTFNLGTAAIGETHAGMIAGQASGVINRVVTAGTINGGNHTFSSDYSIASKFYLGGIVGSADAGKLTITNAINNAPITGFGTTSTFNFASGSTSIIVKQGGIVGYIVNTSTINHSLVNVANKANITISTVGSATMAATQNVGGVFGELTGYAPILETSNVYQFANLYNSGNIIASYVASTATIKSAGIGISNATQAVEYALLFNHGSFTYNNAPSTPNTLFRYTGTIYDVNTGSYAVTLSRAYNYGNRLYDSGFYTKISPLYYSDNNNPTLLRYCANYGSISYIKDSGTTQIALAANLIVSGITSSSNVNYLNVANYGAITLVNLNLNASYSLSVAGITSTLTSGKYMKNCLNEGKITVAKIAGTGNYTTGATNIYIGGLVNYNYSGDLQSQDASSQPVATIGIINSINYGEITTSYGLKSANLYGITGTSNTFAAGIATLNSGSIQDCANLGTIRLYNSATSVTFNFNGETYLAGRVYGYTGGVSAGGVVAVTLAATARVYDSANNGEIVTMALNYARAGGILSTCLYSEAAAGGITSSLGLANTIENSILSNGLNFGNIIAVTSGIGTYVTASAATNAVIYYGSSSGANYYFPASTGTSDRPPVYSSAGGVIGYGLCVMRRMLNHGTISATDVAGGIVGATYVLGASSGNTTTIVNITTAINYGDIKAIQVSYFSTIDPYLLTYANVSAYFYSDNNTFIFPSGFTPETPLSKRGFGGVFGRLQRGTNGYMTSAGGAFDFIVNADPEIDLIGRLDQVQNWSSSGRFFQFNNAIYYSAKWGDTTQDVFTGFYYCYGRATSYTGSGPRIYTFTPTTRYTSVGVTSTNLGSYTSPTFTFPSTTTYNSTTYIYMYQTRITVPWITENPSDAHITNAATQYMYHASFPMRTDPDLTEYIYYMEYNLLADRFKTGGSNPRVNGMYVLSTTAGSTFGSVLPSNLDTDLVRPIDEDMISQLSLLTDYSAISGSNLVSLDDPLDSDDVFDRYSALRQTIFNEKCVLIDPPSAPVTLVENGGSGTVLSNGTVNYTAKTIVFEISMEAFITGGVSVSYLVDFAETSAFATIARRASDYYGHAPSTAELEAYRALLLIEGGPDVSEDYPATLTLTLPAKTITANTTLSLGSFTVYSEAFVGSNLFASSNYYTDYAVSVTFTPGAEYIPTGTLGISTVSFNGAAAVSVTNQADVTALGNVNTAGSIRFNFSDTKGVLTDGQDLKTYVEIRSSDQTTVVDPAYYTLTSTLVSAGVGSVTVTFTSQTRSGNYYMYYRYFSSSTQYNVKFDKSPSTAAAVTGLTHYSSGTSVTINGTAITSLINLGYNITLGASGTSGNFTSSTNGSIPTYLSNTTYTVVYNSTYSNTFTISPFAVLTNAYLSSYTYSNGYKVYTINYVVTAEDGTTQVTYTHTMSTRPIDLSSVLKNGNEVMLSGITAAREDASTLFSVDLGLDPALDLYSVDSQSYPYFTVSVTKDGLGITPGDHGITFSATDALLITMTYAAEPGVYVFTFYLYRDVSNYVTLATTLTITKLEGTESHLTNVKFSEYMTETTYPDITIVDSLGVTVLNPPYDPRAYFGGFDYDGADAIQTYHYQVDGYVSNSPLNSYVPSMLAYLPYGGSISRHAYNSGTSSWYWTSEVYADATAQEIATLATDYTIDPETGLEAGEGEFIRIQYRVTAEDGLTSTYYWITVTDVTYNLTMVFDIYYCTGAGLETCTLASASVDFTDQLVMLVVKNYDTNGDDTVTGVTDPALFPTFSAIQGLNNQLTQFYLTHAGDYQYSFSRNISGFYVLRVDLPQDIYLNDLYTYEIKIGDYTLNDASNYVAGIEGKYYYIEASTKNRTRRFNIYIREISSPATDAPWGLYDFFRSWWN